MNLKIENSLQIMKTMIAILCLAWLIACSTHKPIVLNKSQETAVQPSKHTPGEIWHDPVSNMEFCWIPAGTFDMGWPPNWAQTFENKQHTVTISKGFWMGRFEVTQSQYLAIMETNPSYFKTANSDVPVEQVSWNDAQDYIQKLGAKVRTITYRLPTEAEWEYACRAGNTGHRYGNLDIIGWYTGNSEKSTHPVGQKQPNVWGLYDTVGNVWEWCQDWYGANYYINSPRNDPQGPSEGLYRVIRGGSWDCNPDYVSSELRYPYTPGDRTNFIGFRVVAVEHNP